MGGMEGQPGAIASSCASKAGREAEQVLAQDSPWWPLREQVRARARASQDRPTPASAFAQGLLKAVQQRTPPDLLRLGNGSRALPLLAGVLPKRLLEKVLKKRFGLDRSL